MTRSILQTRILDRSKSSVVAADSAMHRLRIFKRALRCLVAYSDLLPSGRVTTHSHLVKDRMDITGARWSVEGAETVLRLRSLVASHDFEDYWIMHQEIGFQETHAARYAAPPILRRARLRAV
jgi:hypothetical protein